MSDTITKRIAIASFVLLLWYWAFGNPLRLVLAAADPGYTKVGSVAVGTTTYTDTTVADGQTYQYEVTEQNSAGESGATMTGAAVIPATGTHTATVTWTPGSGGGAPTTFNIYRTTIVVPNPPAAASVTVN